MTIEDARRRAIDLFYSPTNKHIIDYYLNKQGSKMTVSYDSVLVSSAQNIFNSEHLFGSTADLYTKASQLSALKGVKLSAYEIVVALISITEAKLANNSKALTQYSEVAALYAVLASLAPSDADPAAERLDEIEAALTREMAAKLAPPEPYTGTEQATEAKTDAQ